MPVQHAFKRLPGLERVCQVAGSLFQSGVSDYIEATLERELRGRSRSEHRSECPAPERQLQLPLPVLDLDPVGEELRRPVQDSADLASADHPDRLGRSQRRKLLHRLGQHAAGRDRVSQLPGRRFDRL